MERRSIRMTSPRGIALVASLCLASSLGLQGVSLAQASLAQAEARIEVEGSLGGPGLRPLLLDRAGDRMYTSTASLSGTELAEYDLTRPDGQRFTRSARFDFDGALRLGNYNAFNREANKLYVIDMPFSHSTKVVCQPGPPPCATIRTVDLSTLQLTSERWDLARLVPGLSPYGMTYSAADQRLYVVGAYQAYVSDITVWQKGAVMPIAVAAIDVTMSGAGSLAWLRPIKTCTLPMVDYSFGTGIYRSAKLPAIYFACSRADSIGVGQQLPGHVGVVRLWIDPSGRSANLLEASTSDSFREDFYRASGSFGDPGGFVARTAFDQVTERLVMVSGSSNTKGAWVFDGALSAWVGFLLSSANNLGLGLDPGSGMIAMKDSSRFLIADLRSTPATQGQIYALPEGIEVSDAVFDGQGRMYWSTDGEIVVARIPALPPRFSSEIDYDSITQDIDEGPGTVVTFSGTSAGFGARVSIVGGSGGASSPVRPSTFSSSIEDQVGTTPFLGSGDRGFHLGRLSTMDLRESGAQASAQALAPDDITANDDRTVRGLDLHREATRDARFVAEQLDQDPDAAASQMQPIEGLPDGVRAPLATTSWPWAPTFCIDGSGEPDQGSAAAGSSSAAVSCNLDAGQADASSRATAVKAEGVSIGEAAITSSARRVPGQVAIESHAWSRNIDIAVGGAGSLRIGEVSLDVVTIAGGRPGTARVEFTRTIEGVEIRDAQGAPVYACATTCDATVVAAHVNETLGGDMKMQVPGPDIVRTDGGAYAGFHKAFDRYISDLVMNNDTSQAMPAIQIEVFHDFADKSRTYIQLAAIDSSSLYGITSGGVAQGPAPGPVTGPPDGPVVDPPFEFPPTGDIEPAPAPAAPNPGIIPRIVQQAMFLTRSPGEAASMLLVLGLIAGFVALSARRRALGGVL
jgi:hypothetical protein